MEINVENFQGPLDLLLRLIEKEELDITTVSLLEVAEQYIGYLATIEKKEPEMLADFLLIAAKLLYIKSRVLLPELFFGDEEDALDLERQLKMYQKFVAATGIVKKYFESDNFAFGRPENIKKLAGEFVPPKSLTKEKLKKIIAVIINDWQAIANLPKKSLAKVMSIKEKILEIQELLSVKEKISFGELINEAKNKTEMIVAFLGILELTKQRFIELKQEGMFSEIVISKCKAE